VVVRFLAQPAVLVAMSFHVRLALRLALVDPNETTRPELVKRFSGLDGFGLETECSRYELFPSLVEDTRPDIALISIDASPDEAVGLIENLRARTPDVAICAISRSTDGERILRIMRAGAHEFLPLSAAAEEIVSALKKLSNKTVPGRRILKECQTIAVAGTSGGVGSTTVAVNLGAILARDASASVVFVDLDLSLGAADVYLDAKPGHCTLVDVAESVSRLDADLLQRSLTALRSNLFLLPRPEQLISPVVVTELVLRRVMGLLKAAFSHIIIDVSKAYTPLDIAALQSATTILLVTQLNLPNLRNVIRVLRSLRELGDLDQKVKIVVNRLNCEEPTIRRKRAEEIIGREVFWELPNEFRLMAEVCNNGVPLAERAPRARITRSLTQLARAVAGETSVDLADLDNASAARTTSRRWLHLWSTNGKRGR
jgi:pilus assembly protein CpaE